MGDAAHAILTRPARESQAVLHRRQGALRLWCRGFRAIPCRSVGAVDVGFLRPRRRVPPPGVAGAALGGMPCRRRDSACRRSFRTKHMHLRKWIVAAVAILLACNGGASVYSGQSPFASSPASSHNVCSRLVSARSAGCVRGNH
jgi:hypothetical protein